MPRHAKTKKWLKTDFMGFDSERSLRCGFQKNPEKIGALLKIKANQAIPKNARVGRCG